MKFTKIVAIPAIALAAGLSLAACGSVKAFAAPSAIIHTPAIIHTVTAPAAVPTPSATTAPAAVPKVVVVVPAQPKTVYVQAPAPAAPALTNCGAGVYAGANTSCPFALNLASDYTGPGLNYAYSPVTGLNYAMNCAGELPIVCTGGNNALVQFYN
jgi:hypothetical protein